MRKNYRMALAVTAMAFLLGGCQGTGTETAVAPGAETTAASESEANAGTTDTVSSDTGLTSAVGETADTEAAGGTLLGEIRERGVLRIGTEGTYSPNSYHDESGELVGFDVEVAEKVAEKLGVEAEFVEGSWDSLFANMDSGRVDLVINEVEATPERAEKYDFSEPYTYVHGALLVTGDNEEITGFDMLEGKRAAQNLSSNWGQVAESYGAELVGVNSMNESVELLLTGRADVTLNAETAFYDYMKNRPDQDVKIVAMTDSTSSSVIPVPKGNEDLLEAINQALDEMRESGELTELSEKYFGADVTTE